MEVRFVCTVCQREYVRQRDARGKAPTVCLECQNENRHLYRKARVKARACCGCGAPMLIAAMGRPKQFCDVCIKQRRAAADALRYQRPEVKARGRLSARRYHARNKEVLSIKRKERHYREKIRAAAKEESQATGLSVEQILAKWRA